MDDLFTKRVQEAEKVAIDTRYTIGKLAGLNGVAEYCRMEEERTFAKVLPPDRVTNYWMPPGRQIPTIALQEMGKPWTSAR